MTAPKVRAVRYDAVVLAGGRSRRMQVADKTALAVGGLSLLDRVLLATDRAATVIVVGPEREVAKSVRWVREDPPGGGPAVAVAAALDVATSDVVVLLAADVPFVTVAHIDRLVAAVVADGAVYVDDAGAEQWLCSAWRTEALRAVELAADGSLRRALSSLSFVTLTDVMVAIDCDTPADLRHAEELLA